MPWVTHSLDNTVHRKNVTDLPAARLPPQRVVCCCGRVLSRRSSERNRGDHRLLLEPSDVWRQTG